MEKKFFNIDKFALRKLVKIQNWAILEFQFREQTYFY